MGEGEGPKGKTTLLPPLSRGQNRGGGRGRRRRPAPASHGAAAARRRGERERGSRGFDSPSYLGLGWSREVGPRGPAAAALGGVRGPGRRRAVVAWDVELEGDAKGRFIGQGGDEEDGAQRPVGEL